jgi:hypothetical protein
MNPSNLSATSKGTYVNLALIQYCTVLYLINVESCIVELIDQFY